MPTQDPGCFYPITLQAIESELRRLSLTMGWMERYTDESDARTYEGQVASLFVMVHAMQTQVRDGAQEIDRTIEAAMQIGRMLHMVEQIARDFPALAWDRARSDALVRADRTDGYDRPTTERELRLGRVSLRLLKPS